MSESKSFTAVGNGPELLVRHGESFEYDVSGTFVGTVLLQQAVKGGWTQLASATEAASGTVIVDAGNKTFTRVRFRCSAFTSGTIVTELTEVTTEVTSALRDASGASVLDVTEDGLTLKNDKALVASHTYSGQDHSFQPVAIDLELAAAAGSNTGTNPKFLAPIMGNVLGDTLARIANYIGGLIGAYSITTSNASEYPTGAVLGVLMDGAQDADSIIHAHIDGSDPSAATNANAAFGVSQANAHASTGVNYGLDLLGAATAYITDGKAFRVIKALLRSPHNVCILEGDGVPVDGTTGDNFAGPGSFYIDYTNANVYIQTSAITTPVWKLVTRAS